MRYSKSLIFILFLTLFASIFSGCGFIFFDNTQSETICYPAKEVCTPFCNTYCDLLSCWQECFEDCLITDPYCEETSDTSTETTTTETTETTTETTETTNSCSGSSCNNPSTNSCNSNSDCNHNQICQNHTCTTKTHTTRGSAGLCQACQSNNDCFEIGAKCLEINFNRTTRIGEKICGRLCQLDTDCPPGFDCIKSSNDAHATSQCVPIVQKTSPNSEPLRTCNATPDLQCVSSNDCSAGQSCKRNSCV